MTTMPLPRVLSRHFVHDRFTRAGPPGRRSAPGTTVEAIEAPSRGDHDLNPDMLPEPPLVRAAVLVPLVDRADGMTVLLTRRTAHLTDHAGQISFPGGRIDPDDIDATAAALREAEEEIGLSRKQVQIIGCLDTYVTRTGYEVTPCVGIVEPSVSLTLNPFEVAEVFETPLEFFREPGNRKLESRIYRGQERFFYVYPWGEYYIWGATAGMISNLVDVLGSVES